MTRVVAHQEVAYFDHEWFEQCDPSHNVIICQDQPRHVGRNRRDPIATPTKPPVRGGTVSNATVTGGKSNWRRKGKK